MNSIRPRTPSNKRPVSSATGASRSTVARQSVAWRSIARKGGAVALFFMLVSTLGFGTYKAAPYVNAEIEQVIVQGDLKRLNEALLSDAIFDNIRGGILTLDIALLQSQVATVPWVESVQVVKRFPATIIVEVTEELAIARWNDQGYISNKGEYIHSSLYEDLAHLPQLSSARAYLQPEAEAKKAIDLFHMLNSVVLISGQQITHLQQSAVGGWRMTCDNGLSVDLGRTDHLNRTRHAMLAWQRLPHKLKNNIDQIDARYANGVAIRSRNNLAAKASQAANLNQLFAPQRLKPTDNPA